MKTVITKALQAQVLRLGQEDLSFHSDLSNDAVILYLVTPIPEVLYEQMRSQLILRPLRTQPV